MNDDTLYRIVFEGRIAGGSKAEEVKARLAALFKTTPQAIEKVFSDAPTVIQKNLDAEKARRYKAAFEQTGALCRVERIETQSTSQPRPQPQAPPQPQAQAEPRFQPEPQQHPETAPQSSPPQMYDPNAAIYTEQAEPQQAVARTTGVQHLEKDAWKALGIGAVITAVVLYFPFLSFVFHYIGTLVHEIGHAFFGWLFGYPSIPAFDFTYGGGFTRWFDQKIIIVIVIYAIFAFLFYFYRRNHLTLVVLLFVTGLYSAAVFTSVHTIVILFMGHGSELVFGSIFFYRGLSGSSLVIKAEQPLYAFLGLFIYFIDIRFAHRLMTSAARRAEYEAAKGGGHWMDFSRIAENHLHIKLASVAQFFFLLCLLTPVITFLFFRYKNYIFDFFRKILNPEPGK